MRVFFNINQSEAGRAGEREASYLLNYASYFPAFSFSLSPPCLLSVTFRNLRKLLTDAIRPPGSSVPPQFAFFNISMHTVSCTYFSQSCTRPRPRPGWLLVTLAICVWGGLADEQEEQQLINIRLRNEVR